MPSTRLTVTTPVPPMPTSPHAHVVGPRSGSGSGNGIVGRRAAGFAAAADGMIVRKDGQSPSRQEKSLLQEAWWMRVLRPNSVSTGSTDRHPDFLPQSPQPSQTRSLISTCCGGSGAFPRLRARRSSAAHA